jgi:hypothetical protein
MMQKTVNQPTRKRLLKTVNQSTRKRLRCENKMQIINQPTRKRPRYENKMQTISNHPYVKTNADIDTGDDADDDLSSDDAGDYAEIIISEPDESVVMERLFRSIILGKNE